MMMMTVLWCLEALPRPRGTIFTASASNHGVSASASVSSNVPGLASCLEAPKVLTLLYMLPIIKRIKNSKKVTLRYHVGGCGQCGVLNSVLRLKSSRI